MVVSNATSHSKNISTPLAVLKTNVNNIKKEIFKCKMTDEAIARFVGAMRLSLFFLGENMFLKY